MFNHLRGKTLSDKKKKQISESMKLRAKDPEWRKRVSEGTTVKMWDSEIRKRHLSNLRLVMEQTENGNTFKGGIGQTPNRLEEYYANIFIPLGYIRDYPIALPIGAGRYRLDFALLENKICIEIDGSSHAAHKNRDEIKDTYLRSLGWKIIRIKEW